MNDTKCIHNPKKVRPLINAERILLLISTTLFLSYVSGIIYNKTKIPDIVWLLGFGIVLGPLLGFFDAEIFLTVFDLMIIVTVALFAFNTGINLNIQQILGHTARAFSLALMSFIAITVSVGVSVSYFLPNYFNLVSGLLLGAMLGGIDGVSISSLISSLGRENKGLGESGGFLQLESTLSDPIKVIGVLTIIKMVLLTGVGPRTAARDILFTLFVSALIGLGSGLIWGEIITRLKDRPLNYMLTIAILFPLYVVSDIITEGGGGPITIFSFGAVLMNYGYVTRSLRMNRRSRIDRRKIREYHDEITFLIKAMFFVYLGLVMQFELRFIEISILLTVLIIVVRFLVASLLGHIQGVPIKQIRYTRFFFIEGVSSLVLSQFVVKYDPSGVYLAEPQLFTNMVVPIVLLSIIFSSVIAPMLAGEQETTKPEEPQTETKKVPEEEKTDDKKSKKREKKTD